MTSDSNHNIETSPHPHCLLCKKEGRMLYSHLKDRLFSAPGSWSLFQCLETSCGLVWLNPAPVKKDIPKAYQTYFTHGEGEIHRQENPIVQFLIRYISPVLNRLSPFRKEQQSNQWMYLDQLNPGRVLDVGCGDGTKLLGMQSLGWQVTGQEVDPTSAAIAKAKNNCEIRIGELTSVGFPADYFDAVTLCHVIEHIDEPIKILQECHRILKPGGTLVVTTPNIESFSHKYFKNYWRDLDAPRHLYLFSMRTLSQVAKNAGFQNLRVRTTTANSFLINLMSLLIRAKKQDVLGEIKQLHIILYIKAWSLKMSAVFLSMFQKDAGEECVLIATK